MGTQWSGVTLTDAERTQLWTLTKKGRLAARPLTRAHLLLQADAGVTQEATAAALHIGRATVVRIGTRVVEEGLAAALRDRPRPGAQPMFDGQQAAFLIALACSTPPEGRTCGTMQLLANTLAELRVVEAIYDGTIRRTLKITHSNPGNESTGVCRPWRLHSSGI
jgi:Homeodomain-like domain